MAITASLQKSSRSIGYLSLVGSFFFLCTLAMLGKTAFDTDQENRHAKWPIVVATITQQGVRQFMNGRHHAWRIDSEVRYTVEGKELTSNIHSGIGSFLDERAMRQWASQHPAGTPLPVRYDPDHHRNVVPDMGAMPEYGTQVQSDEKAVLLLFLLSITLLTIGRHTSAERGANKTGSDYEYLARE